MQTTGRPRTSLPRITRSRGDRSSSGAARILVATALVVLAGCASTPIPSPDVAARPLGAGSFVDQVWVDGSAVDTAGSRRLRLGAIDLSRVAGSAANGLEAYEAAVRSGVDARSGDLAGPLSTDSADDNAEAELRISVTELDTGNGFTRIMAGEFGAGHAWVQIEARLVDLQSNRPIATFVDRRRSSGLMGLRDIAGDAGPTLVQEMLRAATEDAIREMVRLGF